MTGGDRAGSVERFPPGKSAPAPLPGDFVLVRGRTWTSRVVYLGQATRLWRRADRPYRYWSHAALVIWSDGRIAEASARGVICSRLEKYRDADYHYVHVAQTGRARREAVTFACSCVGMPYAPLGYFRPAAATLTLGWLQPSPHRHACASLVAEAMSRAGVVFDRPPAEVLPADLAKHYRVRP